MQTLQIALPTQSGRSSTTIVATASSDGKLRIFDMNDIPSETPTALSSQEPVQISPVAEYDSDKTRFTCVTLADGDSEVPSPANAKRKREDDDDEEEEEVALSEEEAEDDGTDEADEGDEEDEGFGSGWEDEDEMEQEVSGEEEDDPST
jgi:protein MAK11